jgi:hypothetical protein
VCGFLIFFFISIYLFILCFVDVDVNLFLFPHSCRHCLFHYLFSLKFSLLLLTYYFYYIYVYLFFKKKKLKKLIICFQVVHVRICHQLTRRSVLPLRGLSRLVRVCAAERTFLLPSGYQHDGAQEEGRRISN